MLDAGKRRAALLRWYVRHGRRLAWRAQPGERVDPYRVWVSEIILQQTRAAVAERYFRNFVGRFPSVTQLATAPAETVLAAWSGLGYYQRARRLHRAAQMVVAEHGGRLPRERAALLALPGIGAYTAGAILSIAFGEPLTAVDGNAVRIASRLSGRGLSIRDAEKEIATWFSLRHPGDFNQALMDLGATVCTPQSPDCGRCPLRRYCRTRGSLPASGKRKAVAVEYDYRLSFRRRQGELRVWLRQRPAGARQLAEMWELPAARGGSTVLATIRHSITNQKIQANIYAGSPSGDGAWFTEAQAAAAPLTGLTRKALRRLAGWKLD
ncbi:MAG TPA: A/G-specific adenine glycosylase [Terriglobales bacterium]|nr:A/G-specific adenine glycosylase [Terriglobales bacterium]